MRAPLRRALSVPERLGMFGVGVAAAALVWPTVSATTSLSAPCLLRRWTGIPCPACGLTTASVALVRGHLTTAVAANPAVLGLALLTIVVGPLLVLRAVGALPAPVPWSAPVRRAIGGLMILLAIASWVYQLFRLGVV